MGGSIVFARWRQCVHMGGHMAPVIGEYDWTCASFSPWSESTTQTTNRSVQPFLHSSRQKVPILYNVRPFPKKMLLVVWGSGPPSWFLEPDRAHNPNCTTIGSAIFAQVTAECRYTLQWATFSPKIAPSHGDLDPHLTHDSLDPSELTNQTASVPVQPFLHKWPHRVSLYFTVGRPFPPRNCHFSWGGSGPHLIHGSLGP